VLSFQAGFSLSDSDRIHPNLPRNESRHFLNKELWGRFAQVHNDVNRA
jgi:hypothetical protein